MNMIKVSVIICSYNRRQYLKQAIDSVLAQNLFLDNGQSIQLQIVVGDDGSVDGSRELLAEYSTKHPGLFVLNFQKENRGIGYNWASTVQLSDGEYIANLDDDDYWHNRDKLTLQVNYLLRHPEVSVVGTDYRTLDINSGKYRDVRKANTYPDDLPKAIWNGTFSVLQSSTLIRRSDIDKYVNLEDFKKYHFVMQDWPCLVLLSRYTKFAHLPVITTTYRTGGPSLSNDNCLSELESKLFGGKLICQYLLEEYFDEKEYSDYFNRQCLNGTYRFHDYEGVHRYGAMVGGHSIKVICSKNRTLFEMWCLLKTLRKKIEFPSSFLLPYFEKHW